MRQSKAQAARGEYGYRSGSSAVRSARGGHCMMAVLPLRGVTWINFPGALETFKTGGRTDMCGTAYLASVVLLMLQARPIIESFLIPLHPEQNGRSI